MFSSFKNRYFVFALALVMVVGVIAHFNQPSFVAKIQPTSTTPTALPSVATVEPTRTLREGAVQMVSNDYLLQLTNWALRAYAKGCVEVFEKDEPSPYVPGCVLMGTTYATNSLLRYVLWGKTDSANSTKTVCNTKRYLTMLSGYFILKVEKYGIDNSHNGCDYSPLMINVQTAHGFYSWVLSPMVSNLLVPLI